MSRREGSRCRNRTCSSICLAADLQRVMHSAVCMYMREESEEMTEDKDDANEP